MVHVQDIPCALFMPDSVVNSAVAIILMVSVSFVFPHRVIFVFRDDFRHSLGRWE